MAPTYDQLNSFHRDRKELSEADLARFRLAVSKFVADLDAGTGFRPGLRVKRVQGTEKTWEMTWAPDGRATFQFGPEIHAGQPHVIWRRIGTHEIFDTP